MCFVSLNLFLWSITLLVLNLSLHICDKAHLIMVDDFDVFLNFVCKYVVNNFCICVHQGD